MKNKTFTGNRDISFGSYSLETCRWLLSNYEEPFVSVVIDERCMNIEWWRWFSRDTVIP